MLHGNVSAQKLDYVANEVLGDEVLRKNFQVCKSIINQRTGRSISMEIRKSRTPKRPKISRASQDVLIGYSMGGVLFATGFRNQVIASDPIVKLHGGR